MQIVFLFLLCCKAEYYQESKKYFVGSNENKLDF